MSLSDAVDQFVDALDKVQLGDEYEPGASMPWRTAVERWDLYVTLVSLIDRAVGDPFGDSSAALLLAAAAIHDDNVYELAFALTHAGEAITRARSAFVAEEDRHG
jgi:hypothetical protein